MTLGFWMQHEIDTHWSVWGFTDLHSTQKDDHVEFASSLSEYRLRYDFLPDFRLESEINVFTPMDGDVWRLGGAAQLGRPYFLSTAELWIRGFPIQSDGGQELSLEWFVPLRDRLSFVGFLDVDFRHGTFHVVAEPALLFALTDHFSLIAEARYNGFEEDVPHLSGFGMSDGVIVSF